MQSVNAVTDSIFTFVKTSDTECSVRLSDKTATIAVVPKTAKIGEQEYTVTSVAINGFASATLLKKVRLPETVKTIGNSAFTNCKELTSITFPGAVSIGLNAFSNCTKLEKIVLPSSITTLGATILRNNNTKVYARATSAASGWNANWNGSNANKVVEYASNYTPTVEYEVVEPVTTMSSGTTRLNSLNNGYVVVAEHQEFVENRNEEVHIYIPAEYDGKPVVGISAYAFEFNVFNSLTVAYANTPINIEENAFYGFSGTSLTINRDITTNGYDINGEYGISNSVFTTSEFKTIILPSSITNIGSYMFYGCPNLTDIHFIEPIPLTHDEEINIVNNLQSTGIIDLPSSMVSIGSEAFSQLLMIEELKIPNSVTVVDSSIIVEWSNSQKVSIDFNSLDELPIGWATDWNSNSAAIILTNGTYDIVYNLDGGINSSANPATYTSRDEIVLKEPAREGYTFNGWYANAELTEICSKIEMGSFGDKTLYAKWTNNIYTVKYDSNKPANASADINLSTSNSIHTYDIPKSLTTNGYRLTGWTFKSWNTKADGTGTSYSDGASILNLTNEANAVVSLFAQWTANTYEVDYISNKPNNASGAMTGTPYTSSHVYDTQNNLAPNASPNAYALEGWHLTGWNQYADGSGTNYATGQAVKNLTDVQNGRYTLYAQWEQNEYQIRYLPNATFGVVSGDMPNSNHTYEQMKALSENQYSIAGSTFSGWNTNADGSGRSFSNCEVIGKLPLQHLTILNLYAQWGQNGYFIVYYENKPIKASHDVEGSMKDTYHDYYATSSLAPNKYTLVGWDFVGWATSSSGDVVYEDGAYISGLTDLNNGTIYLYAKWRAQTYNIVYLPNKPSNASGQVNGNMPNSIHVYDTPEELTTNSYTLANWTFNGWSVTAGGAVKYSDKDNVNIVPGCDNATIQLFAQWEGKKITIIYDKNKPSNASSEVEGTMGNSIFGYDNVNTLRPNAYSLKGWTFKGWATSPTGPVEYLDEAELSGNPFTSSEIILYAVWEANTYKVYYDSNKVGATGTMTPSDHVYDTPSNLTKNAFSVSTYTFAGWSITPEGKVEYADEASVSTLAGAYKTNDTITLYAIWTAQEYTVEYNVNTPSGMSYSGSTEKSKHTIDQSKQLTKNGYHVSGYLFKGWSLSRVTKVDYVDSLVQYTDQKSVINLTTKANSTVTLYAVWAKYYKVTLDGNGAFIGWHDTDGDGNTDSGLPFQQNSFNAIAGVTINLEWVFHIDYKTSWQDQNGYGFNIPVPVEYPGYLNVGSFVMPTGNVTMKAVKTELINPPPPPPVDPPTEGGGCVATGTLITLADGTRIPVEQLTGNELLLVWNLYTGQFDVAPILFIDRDAETEYKIINLYFSDGTSVKVIYEHGFWDVTLNEYVFLRDDAAQYIGHWFNKQTTDKNGEMGWTSVQLTNVVITTELTTAWSPVTASHLCYYVNGMLSMPGATTGLINIFEVDGETMKYDEAQMAADIATYGLFTYEEFNELVPLPEEMFEAFGGQYLKVSIGKGLIDIDTLKVLVAKYISFLA